MRIIDISSCISSDLSNKLEENSAKEIRYNDDDNKQPGSQGIVYDIISIDGKNVTGLKVKLFFKGLPSNLIDIIKAVRENKVRYKIDQCIALRALPLFLFEGKIDGNISYGYVMRKVEGEKFAEYVEKEDSKKLNFYINLPLKDRLHFCHQFVEGMSILYGLTIIHADINGSNLIIDFKRKMLAIIDVDGGTVAKTESKPITMGKFISPSWLAPEIFSQYNKDRSNINVKITADLWSISCGIHYLLFGIPPFFFVFDRLDIPQYLKSHEWPKIRNINVKTHNESNFDYYERNYSKLPEIICKKFEISFREGYLDPNKRIVADEWLNVIKLSQQIATKPNRWIPLSSHTSVKPQIQISVPSPIIPTYVPHPTPIKTFHTPAKPKIILNQTPIKKIHTSRGYYKVATFFALGIIIFLIFTTFNNTQNMAIPSVSNPVSQIPVTAPIATSSMHTTTPTSSLIFLGEKTLGIGETWDVGGGYAISAQSIDAKANPRLVWLALSKDGHKLDDKVLQEGQTYSYGNFFSAKIYNIYVGEKTDMVRLTDIYVASESIQPQTQTSTQVIPKLVFKGTESYVGSDGKQYVRYRLTIENRNAFPIKLFEPAPDLPPCGLNTKSSRTWVNIYDAKDNRNIYGFCALPSSQELDSIWFGVSVGVSPPDAIYVQLIDRKENKIYLSNTVTLPKDSNLDSTVSSVTPSSDQQTITNSIGMEFVLIPAGEFDMGSPSSEKGRYDDREGPIHRVKIAKAFYMGKYMVTQKQWRDIMGTNPSYFKGDNLPVGDVEWNDVQEFIRKLNGKEGNYKYRLPSESEWEYAARAGTTTRYFFGDDESELGEYAWYKDNSGDKAHDVGLKKPNPWGLYDMYGNGWEWVQDTFHYGYIGAPTDGSAWESVDVSLRVSKGGSSLNDAGVLRSAVRIGSGPGHSAMPDNSREILSGFRLARDL